MLETIKEFCTILLGHNLTVYTDHKNLTVEKFTTERVLRWRLMLEEYGSKIKYIKGPDNDAKYALIRHPLINYYVKEGYITREHDKLDSKKLPLTYQKIDKYQHKEKNLVEKLKLANYHIKYFC